MLIASIMITSTQITLFIQHLWSNGDLIPNSYNLHVAHTRISQNNERLAVYEEESECWSGHLHQISL